MSTSTDRQRTGPDATRAPAFVRDGRPVARPSALRQSFVLAQAMLRGFFRDRTALFFTFFFPLMFLIVFGLVFRSSGAEPTEIGVVGDGPIVSALPSELFTVKHFDSLDEAVEKVRSGDLPAVVAEEGDQVTLRFAASDQVKAGTIQGVVASVVDQANIKATGQHRGSP
jgi:ABC-2 type transport system permease protein